MPVSAADVKKLRELTDAPMMECKAALEEAGGDFERAKDILREKGQAAAAKRAGRSTAEGIAQVAVSGDGKKVAGVIVECETDFVANNADFKSMVERLVNGVLNGFNPAAGEVMTLNGDSVVDGKSINTWMEEAVAVIRENIVCRKAIVAGASEGAVFGGYNHHTRKIAAIGEAKGTASNLGEIGFQLGVQVTAFPAQFLSREDVPQDALDREIEVEVQRAINEGKPEDAARKIAVGRVNKGFVQTAVLLEQPYYGDAKLKTADFVSAKGKEGGGTAEAVSYHRLAVGDSEGE